MPAARRLAGFVGALALALGAAAPAHALVFRVNSTKDKLDLTIDGNCEAANGRCTLRAALTEANSLLNPGLERIRVPAGTYPIKNHPGSGILDAPLRIEDETEIVGAGADRTTIRQTDEAGVIDIPPTADPEIISISGLTVTGGGGAGGGITASGFALALDDVTVRGNERRGDFGQVRGGGIYSTGSLAVSDSRITNNRAHATAVGGGSAGGGLAHAGEESDATLEIDRTRISGNRATVGGGAENAAGGGLFTQGLGVIERSTVARNTAEAGSGGGLFHTGSVQLSVTRSTVSENAARAGGGIASFGPLRVENSTVSSNRVEGPPNGITLKTFAGGILRSGGALALSHSTIARNRAPASPPPAGSGVFSSPAAGSLTLRATVLENPGPDCTGTGTITSLGYNVDSGMSCVLGGVGDQSGADPRLGGLSENGGPTLTHALLGGSAARNAVTAGCPPPDIDQRGATRPHGSACDAGSYERG